MNMPAFHTSEMLSRRVSRPRRVTYSDTPSVRRFWNWGIAECTGLDGGAKRGSSEGGGDATQSGVGAHSCCQAGDLALGRVAGERLCVDSELPACRLAHRVAGGSLFRSDLGSTSRSPIAYRRAPASSPHGGAPEYAAFLGELKARLSKGLSPGDMEWAFAAYDRFRNDLVERVLHDGSAFLTTVSEPQIRHVEKVLFHEERKARESFDGSRDARASTRRTKPSLWRGSGSDRCRPDRWRNCVRPVRALPDVEPIWLESRRQRRQAFIALLREGARGQHLADRLRGIVNPSVEQSGSARARLDREWRAGVTAVILELDRLLTPLQRGRALSSIQDVLDDIRTLTRDP
jgi:hypothetical protein